MYERCDKQCFSSLLNYLCKRNFNSVLPFINLIMNICHLIKCKNNSKLYLHILYYLKRKIRLSRHRFSTISVIFFLIS